MEYWEPISENYSISSFGRLWSARIGLMKTPRMNTGYEHANIMQKCKHVRVMIHQYVAKYFIPNPKHLPQVNHKNGIRWDNRVENLEWVTCAENLEHARKVLGHRMASDFPERKKAVIVTKEGETRRFGGIRECARSLNIHYQSVQKALKGETRKCAGWSIKYD